MEHYYCPRQFSFGPLQPILSPQKNHSIDNFYYSFSSSRLFRHKYTKYIFVCIWLRSFWYCSVTKPSLTLWDPVDWKTPASPVLHYLGSLLRFMSIESVMLSNHRILCWSLLLLPSIFPSFRVFSNELAHQVAKILELQLQHNSFQWTFRVDFL